MTELELKILTLLQGADTMTCTEFQRAVNSEGALSYYNILDVVNSLRLKNYIKPVGKSSYFMLTARGAIAVENEAQALPTENIESQEVYERLQNIAKTLMARGAQFLIVLRPENSSQPLVYSSLVHGLDQPEKLAEDAKKLMENTFHLNDEKVFNLIMSFLTYAALPPVVAAGMTAIKEMSEE